MSHFKRRKPRTKVRCRLCTDGRDYTGGDRLRGKRDYRRDARDELEAIEEEKLWETSSENPANHLSS